jgi:hypothetical protein
MSAIAMAILALAISHYWQAHPEGAGRAMADGCFWGAWIMCVFYAASELAK